MSTKITISKAGIGCHNTWLESYLAGSLFSLLLINNCISLYSFILYSLLWTFPQLLKRSSKTSQWVLMELWNSWKKKELHVRLFDSDCVNVNDTIGLPKASSSKVVEVYVTYAQSPSKFWIHLKENQEVVKEHFLQTYKQVWSIRYHLGRVSDRWVDWRSMLISSTDIAFKSKMLASLECHSTTRKWAWRHFIWSS